MHNAGAHRCEIVDVIERSVSRGRRGRSEERTGGLAGDIADQDASELCPFRSPALKGGSKAEKRRLGRVRSRDGSGRVSHRASGRVEADGEARGVLKAKER